VAYAEFCYEGSAPNGRTAEAQRAKSGSGVLGRGSEPTNLPFGMPLIFKPYNTTRTDIIT